MDSALIESIRNHCEARYLSGRIANSAYSCEGSSLWEFHILPVVRHAEYLCSKHDCDTTAVLASSYFHDITRLDGDDEHHHVSSAQYAVNYLATLDVDADTQDLVYAAIREHRGSLPMSRRNCESAVVASADGFALITHIHLLFYSAYRKNGLSLADGVRKVIKKIKRSRLKLLPESEVLVDAKYGPLIDDLESIAAGG